MRHPWPWQPIAPLAVALAACGGGGTINSTPTLAPAPSPSPSPVLPPDRMGLTSSQPFAVRSIGFRAKDGQTEKLADDTPIRFRYVAATDSYEAQLPGAEAGRLRTFFLSGPYGSTAHFTASEVVTASGAALPDLAVRLPVPGSPAMSTTYTSFAHWGLRTDDTRSRDHSFGLFAYGIPTAPGDVPTSGTARYAGAAKGYVAGGSANAFEVIGTSRLDFDFSAGHLSGYLDLSVPESGWVGFGPDLGRYQLTDTAYARGATTFAARLAAPDLPNAETSFSGLFTGPRAAELMAQFKAPFLKAGVSGVVEGIVIGKRD